MTHLVAIALAGALGALARHGLSGLVQRWADPRFPYGTLAVNVLGCLLLGWLATVTLERWPLAPAVRAAVLIGFLGAFTTFSTFGWETLALVREGAVWRAALNVGLSVVLCLAACGAGIALGSRG